MLRMKIEIHPSGDPLDRKVIHSVDVSQVDEQDRSTDSRDYDYVVLEHNDMIPEGHAGHKMVVGMGKILGHPRRLGALELVRRVLEEHILFGPHANG